MGVVGAVLVGLAATAWAAPEPEASEFLIYEQAEVITPGEGGYASMSIGLAEGLRRPLEVRVFQGDGESAWTGRPGHRANFGAVDVGKVMVEIDGKKHKVTVPKRPPHKADRPYTCWLTVKAGAGKPSLQGQCVPRATDIPVRQSACHAPVSPPARGLALLTNVHNMLGCMAWNYKMASNVALEARADIAAALGLKSEADRARLRLENLNGVEDPVEQQALRASAMSDPSLSEAIEAAAQDEARVSSASVAAIQQADARRRAARSYARAASAKAAEMSAYITTTALVYAVTVAKEAKEGASNPLEAAQAALYVAKMMAELRPTYLRTVVAPLGRTVKQSGDRYRATATRLDQAMDLLYDRRQVSPPAPAELSVETIESDEM
ncbi:MAG: hypothetical protein ACON5B_17175 [Myxococcota bacterium]